MQSSIKNITRCLGRNEPPPQANPSVAEKKKWGRKMVTPRFLFISPTCSLEQGTDACGGIQSVVTAHQQKKNLSARLIKDRGESIFSIGLFESETNIVGTRMPRPKMGWSKLCLYVRAHKNQTSLNLWDPSLQPNLVPAKTFPGMSLATNGPRDRTLQQHVAWPVMSQNAATRCQASAELFGYSLDTYVVHIPPRLQRNKRKKKLSKT